MCKKNIGIEEFIFCDNDYEDLSAEACKMMSCSALWIFKVTGASLNVFVSERSIFEHYWNKHYYLYETDLYSDEIKKDQEKMILGTDNLDLRQCGFLRDLHKIFGVEDFVTIGLTTKFERYWCRLFAENNRFVFNNCLVNSMPIIKLFLKAFVARVEPKLQQHPTINMAELKL